MNGENIKVAIKAFAEREYPADYEMQEYEYNKQLEAYLFMKSVDDLNVKKFAIKEWPNNYDMQQYVYTSQVSAKKKMAKLGNDKIKDKAILEYPNDYDMQIYIYDSQSSAKKRMSEFTNDKIKEKAVLEYPNDYDMQVYVYEGLRKDYENEIISPKAPELIVFEKEKIKEIKPTINRLVFRWIIEKPDNNLDKTNKIITTLPGEWTEETILKWQRQIYPYDIIKSRKKIDMSKAQYGNNGEQIMPWCTYNRIQAIFSIIALTAFLIGVAIWITEVAQFFI